VRTLFEEPFDLGEATLHVQCSVGAAATDDPDTSSAELIRRADQAMYVAKHAGDGIRVYESAMAEHVNVQMFMEEDLRRALTGDQFEVHYQPTVDIPTGRVTGVEALLRWEHPDRGLVSPDTFIPLAEDTGLIVPIGAWVLGEACRRVTMWNVGRDVPLTVGVNVSGRQLQQTDFADAVIRTLDATGCRPEWLLLEITETALIATLETASPGLRRLRDLGIHIGLDDFGTGYSSLTYLRHLPVDVLKIDRSFVTEVGSRPDQRTLVSAVVEMARALSMHTVAEGVELEEERAVLRAIGCESAQGYLYTRPLPAAEIDRLLATGPPPLEPQPAEATTPAGEEATEPDDRQATV
jgi:EAL domain-containing protein (putative c-di-GMP-specific phosphodiesterase class I)